MSDGIGHDLIQNDDDFSRPSRNLSIGVLSLNYLPRQNPLPPLVLPLLWPLICPIHEEFPQVIAGTLTLRANLFGDNDIGFRHR
jgi:hypothetical protein